ncbi:unnamed protein product [Prunus armeniaca]
MLEQIRSLQPTVHKAVNPYPSLPIDSEHASMTVNQGAIRSVYLITSYFGIEEPSNAIYGVKFKHGGGVTHEPPVIGLVDRFYEGEEYEIIRMEAAHIFNRSKLYILAQSGGYIIDTKTMSRCSSFPLPRAYKSIQNVVSAYDKLYCLAIRSSFNSITDPSLERYDPDKNVWEELPSYQFYNPTFITGYTVEVDTSVDYAPFQRRAVDGHGSIVYSLSQLFILQDLEIVRPPLPFDMESEYLVHLGNHDFFHVKTGRCFDKAEYLCITTFQIVVGEGERYMIKTINSTVHSVDLECAAYFDLVLCFMT